jgi:ribonucleoside-diphosphate reductase alpha chain
VPVAVRLLDNVIDATRFPLPQQQASVRRTRRIGLGITGLADALVMLGLRYDSEAAFTFAADTMRRIRDAAYRQSLTMAEEKGAFPAFESARYLEAPFIRALPPDIRDGIARCGIRNSHLLSIAPTGTISLLAGNLSSGIEPVFSAEQSRMVLDAGGAAQAFQLADFAVQLWRNLVGRTDGVPEALVTAPELPIQAHLGMQAALQVFVDNAISKTINVPAETSFADFAPLYRTAYDLGLKGCTAFRPSAELRAVLAPAPASAAECRPAGECE